MNTDYKTVFQLAQDKGYKLFFDWSEALRDNPDHDEVYEINPQLTTSELSLIQKWLRDEHKIAVTSAPFAKDKFFFSVEHLQLMVHESEAMNILVNVEEESRMGYKLPTLDEMTAMNYSYESALLEGIHEALKLL